MDDRQDPPPSRPVRKASRLAREAEALRANLRRRKDQARQRDRGERADAPAAPGPDAPDPDADATQPNGTDRG